jgi:hypothetical protein
LKTYEKLLTQTDSNKNCSDSIEPSKLFTEFAQEIPLTDQFFTSAFSVICHETLNSRQTKGIHIMSSVTKTKIVVHGGTEIYLVQ